jgi:hypothetical protein
MKKASRTLKQNKHFLRKLPKVFGKYGNCKTCKKITATQMKCLREVFHNLVVGNIPITREIFNKLMPFGSELVALSDKKSKLKKRREVLKQVGDGVFPVLFASILPIVLDFITRK